MDTAQLIAEGRYANPKLVIDTAGAAHLVAAGPRGVYYFTNKSGSWTRVRLSEVDQGYSIALDTNGTIWMAFGTSDGISVIDGHSADTAPRELVGGAAVDPSLIVRDGHLFLAYVSLQIDQNGDLQAATVKYATDLTGTWTVADVAPGWFPSLQVDSHDRPRILFRQYPSFEGPLQYAVGGTPAGSFSVQNGPQSGDGTEDEAPQLVLDHQGTAHATWLGQFANVYYSRLRDGWSKPELPFADSDAPLGGHFLAVDSAGAAHIAAAAIYFGGTAYATNSDGGFTQVALDVPGRVTSDAAVAVDEQGRPHFVYAQFEVRPRGDGFSTRNHELIYRIGLPD